MKIETRTMSSLIRKNLQLVQSNIKKTLELSPWKQECTLVAVSKTMPAENIKEAYDASHRHFGENYIQEIVQKAPQLPADIKWHFIGHIQSNKAKMLLQGVPNLYQIETIDSTKLANILNKIIAGMENRNNKILKVMVQVNTSGEEQKSGISPKNCLSLVQHIRENCPLLEFTGLMTIGRLGEPSEDCFQKLVECRQVISKFYGQDEKEIGLSMGMSGDYETAIQLGSTNVRIGSTIFGARN